MEGKRNYVARFSSLLVSCAILSACYAPIVAPTQSEVVEMPLESEEPTLESTVTPTTSPTLSPTPSKPDVVPYSDVFDACNGAEKVNLQPGFTFGQLVTVAHECYGNIAPEINLQEGLLSHLMRYNLFDGETMPDENAVIDRQLDLYMEKSQENLDLLGFNLVNLSGKVFFDYNGSGEQENGEPEIEGVHLCIDNYGSDLCTFTGLNGNYSIEGILEGKHDVLIEGPENVDQLSKFHFISLSKETIQTIDSPVSLKINNDLTRDFGLTQGFLTMPVPCEMISGTTKYVDLDYRLGYVRRWDGLTSGASIPDQHPGIDYHGERYTPIIAAAPGLVIGSAMGGDESKSIRIIHDLINKNFVTDYAHNDSVKVHVGDEVKRGEEIALMGSSGVEIVHVHFELWPLPLTSLNFYSAFLDYIFDPNKWTWIPNTSGDSFPSGLDPYQDLSDHESQNYWTVHNDPQCMSRY